MLKTVLIIGTSSFVAWLLFFQILIPYAFNRPLFGMFKSRDRLEIENEIAEAQSDSDMYSLEEDLARRERQNIDRARGVNQV